MSYVAGSHPMIKKLLDAGIIPPQCYDFSLSAPVGSVVTMTVSCYVTEEQFKVITDAMVESKEELLRDAKTFIRNIKWGEASPTTGPIEDLL